MINQGQGRSTHKLYGLRVQGLHVGMRILPKYLLQLMLCFLTIQTRKQNYVIR